MNKINFIAYSIVCICEELSVLFGHSSGFNETDVCNCLKEIKEIVHLKGFYVYSSYKEKTSFDIELYFYNYNERITLNYKRIRGLSNNVESYVPSIKNRIIFVSEQMPLCVEGIVYCSRKPNVLIVCDDLYDFPYLKTGERVSLNIFNSLENYSCDISYQFFLRRQQVMDFVELNKTSINNIFLQNICINDSYMDNNWNANLISEQLDIEDIDVIVGITDEICDFINKKGLGEKKCFPLSEHVSLIDKAGWVRKAVHKLFVAYIYANDNRGLKESIYGFIKDYSLSENYFRKSCLETLEKDDAGFILDALN